MFNISRNYCPVFQSVCTILHPHQLGMRIPVPPWPHEKFIVFFFFLTITILVVVKWYLTVVLICLSPVTNDFEHLFMFLAIGICFGEKCPLKLNPILIRMLVFFY